MPADELDVEILRSDELDVDVDNAQIRHFPSRHLAQMLADGELWSRIPVDDDVDNGDDDEDNDDDDDDIYIMMKCMYVCLSVCHVFAYFAFPLPS